MEAMAKKNLIGMTQVQLEELMAEFGEKPYRGRQLFTWLYGSDPADIADMTSLSTPLRDRLSEKYSTQGLTLEASYLSVDGSEKFAFVLDDGQIVETVLIPEEDRGTVCLSIQVGCALDCSFCATGQMGFSRDLTAGEIVGQLCYLRQLNGPDSITNVVFMGMGESMLNFDNLSAALEIITNSLGFDLSPKRVVVSTAGVVPGIMKLADLKIKPKLAVSLNAATDEKRQTLMPVAKSYNLEKLMKAVKHYATVSGAPVTFEYILFKGINDTMADVEALARLVSGLSCKINVLSYNPVGGIDLKRPTDKKVDWFAAELSQKVAAVTVRRSRGRDIAAACGQLATQLKK